MDIVDKAFARLGIYDLVGVWLSGAIIMHTTDIMRQLLFERSCMTILKENYFVAFLACYVAGLLFQEITSFIHKSWICKNENKYLKTAIEPKSRHYMFMEEEEIDTVNKDLTDRLKLGKADRKENIIYSYCKNYYYAHANTVSVDRDQSIAAMSRSLSFYCFFAVFLPLTKMICLFSDSSANCCNVILLSLLIIVLVLLGLLLYHRFTYRRFIAIYRYYLYNEIWN